MNYQLILALSILMIGCNSPAEKKETAPETDMILLSKAQFQSANMNICPVAMQNFNEEVKCNGYIQASKDGFAQISTPVSGIVESINYSFNDYVTKGKILFQLSSDELMTLQHDYAETSAKLEKIKADYERITTLYAESIQAKKDFINVESEFKSIRAKNYSIKLRLKQLGLEVSKIDNGDFYSSYPVKAPINGYIVTQNLAIGQFTEPPKILAEIVDTDQLQLQLSVFENDIVKLKPGQAITFQLLREPGTHLAILVSKGKTIDSESKTIQCIAQIKRKKEISFINKSYVVASINTNRTSQKALPNEAILKAGNDAFVFKLEGMDKENYRIKKIKVNIGRQSNEFSEVTNLPVGLEVISRGTYYLNNN